MPNDAGDLFAAPRQIQSLNDCYFYHTIDLPGYGTVEGEFDFRDRPGDYLGNVALAAKRVFEIGSANGFFTFFMERQGADVVGFDLAETESWDVVPYAQYDYRLFIAERRRHIEKLKNAFWLAHSVFHSKANIVYGDAYKIPESLGPFDVGVLGCVLQHVRDPFSVLENVARVVTDTVVVTELLPQEPTTRVGRQLKRVTAKLSGKPFLRKPLELSHAHEPFLEFCPDPNGSFLKETWWFIWPATVKRFLEVLGFEHTQTTYHQHKYQGHPSHLFTVVGHRTRPFGG